ncbi:MAG: SDR family oxidoreductase [Chromatiales bacterium]|nr:SDR family oxidoreductase [Chromatiales bacterium]
MNQRKVVIVTGSSAGGIGHCVAHGLKTHGYRVFATARKAEDVEKLKSEGLESIQLDLADSNSINSAVDEILKLTDGRVDVLFNNGAFGQPGAVEDLTREVLRFQFETNLFGTHELTNRIIPVMRKQGHGRIIQNSSLLGYVALRFRGAYNASKFALEGLTDTLRLELQGSGIQISLIEPGPVTSRFRTNGFELYKKNIDKDKSVFKESYEATERRLKKEGPAAPFTLPPEAVLKKVIHAIESKRPKIRYRVTFPAHLFAWLKRILSSRRLDSVLGKVE